MANGWWNEEDIDELPPLSCPSISILLAVQNDLKNKLHAQCGKDNLGFRQTRSWVIRGTVHLWRVRLHSQRRLLVAWTNERYVVCAAGRQSHCECDAGARDRTDCVAAVPMRHHGEWHASLTLVPKLLAILKKKSHRTYLIQHGA